MKMFINSVHLIKSAFKFLKIAKNSKHSTINAVIVDKIKLSMNYEWVPNYLG